MLGASGTFNNLHYLHPADNPGIYDSKSGAGFVFYNRRLSKRHYFGGVEDNASKRSACTEHTVSTG